jgi:hypothetical protein
MICGLADCWTPSLQSSWRIDGLAKGLACCYTFSSLLHPPYCCLLNGKNCTVHTLAGTHLQQAIIFRRNVINDTWNLSRPLPDAYWEIGFRYFTNGYHGNRLSLSILRQKMELSDVWCLLTAGWLLLRVSKYLGYNSSIRTEKYTESRNNQTLNSRTKTHRIKEKQNEWQSNNRWTIKTGNE